MDILDSYSGANNYILSIKTKKEKNKKFYPTRGQSDYITTYHDVKPKVARKWVDLDTYFAKKFAEEKYLFEIPDKIYIEKLLVEKENLITYGVSSLKRIPCPNFGFQNLH